MNFEPSHEAHGTRQVIETEDRLVGRTSIQAPYKQMFWPADRRWRALSLSGCVRSRRKLGPEVQTHGNG